MEMKTYNILPLESENHYHDILELPEVRAARGELNNYDRYELYQKDIFEALGEIFGFQPDNIRNQREHLVLLLANYQSQWADKDPYIAGGQKIPEETYKDVCDKIMQNYVDWCLYMKQDCSYKGIEKTQIALVALYLCIWGEAANIRFLPECICYIFHHMAKDYEDGDCRINWMRKHGGPFLDVIVTPIYKALKKETEKNNVGQASHSKWRNYDDFNEYFWTPSCFKMIGWPIQKDSPFFSSQEVGNGSNLPRKKSRERKGRSFGKTSFVEHRTFFHLYHSFVRVWILLVMMFQGLAIMAHVKGFSVKTVKLLLSLGPTYFFMKFIESVLDIFLMFGAYKRSPFNASVRICAHFFFYGGCMSGLIYLYWKMMLEGDTGSDFFKINLLILGSYMVFSFMISLLLTISSFRSWSAKSDKFQLIESLKWLYQDRYFVGRRMFEKFKDYIRYVCFWVALLGCKFTFSYFLQIKPLMDATPAIISYDGHITYVWHDFVSKNNHNALTVFFLWAPVTIIYLLDIVLWYAVFSAILGAILGARDHLGEIRTLDMIRHRFDTFPSTFVKRLQHDKTAMAEGETDSVKASEAKKFAPFWNKIISFLRDEDYISNDEKELLLMPEGRKVHHSSSSGGHDEKEQPLEVKGGEGLKSSWRPLFLLVGKVSVAVDLAIDRQWEKVKRDPIMISAVNEVLHSGLKLVLNMVKDKQDEELLKRSMGKLENITVSEEFDPNKFVEVVECLKLLINDVFNKTPKKTDPKKKPVTDVYRSMNSFLSSTPSRIVTDDDFSNIPASMKESFKRLHSLLTKESVSTIPRNGEARRRLQFFTNSLFMKMPVTPTVRAMRSFSVLTPYYGETVLFSQNAIQEPNEDGITILFYLQKVFPDEWSNFLERIKLLENAVDMALQSGKDSETIMAVRLWASYRGQTLARTVRGMMYYKEALTLESQNDTRAGVNEVPDSALLEFYAKLKFTYVVSCQIYGRQKSGKKSEATDILQLMRKNEDLRIAFVHNEENKKGEMEYFSKLVKVSKKQNQQVYVENIRWGDPQKDDGEEQIIYSIKLPGNPILGEGKPENQNHAVIFTRGDALQTIDMNQDNYFEEALKMRNLLEEFKMAHGTNPPTILGVREHVFTGSVSSLAWFMSNQEASFVTLGQRVLARPLKIRMHYGHPDVFDRIFHLTRGGFSKASKAINVSEDIYAGFNTTLRRGNITHHEYIQVGKGRDVGLNQIASFEAKVASGNGEQSLSRDVYRLGQLLDFFRMLSFYVTSVGYYFSTMMMVLAIYLFLYGKAYLALSGIENELETLAHESKNKALQSSLDTQFLFQMGGLTAIPMLAVFILEQGILKACISFITMQLQLCSVFFTFSLGTRAHYFGKTILHGGAKYRATGRGFVVKHIKFAENYRLYSRSHFVKGLEIVMLLLAYLVYGYNKSSISYTILSISSWFVAVTWLFAPSIFNPSGLEWQKTVDDFDDWTNWLMYRGGVGVKQEVCWEAWWEDQDVIRSLWGRILETILSLRFLLLQYGVVYHLKGVKDNTSLAVYGVSWLILLGVIIVIEIFSYIPKRTRCNMWLRLFRVVTFIAIIAGLVAVVILTDVTVGDIFASILALIPTGWGILCIGVAWKPVMKRMRLWTSLRSIARFYDAAMGTVIFFPLAVLSWFPFMSTLQTRLLFNQAFSRGLEISLILAGNRPSY